MSCRPLRLQHHKGGGGGRKELNNSFRDGVANVFEPYTLILWQPSTYFKKKTTFHEFLEFSGWFFFV